MTLVVPPERHHHHDLEQLRARVAELGAESEARGAAFAKAQADVTAFKFRYKHEVGLLHDELDRLELALAEAELGEISKRVDPAAADAAPVDARPEPQPRFTTDAVRKLFRDVAKVIHPDLARDAETRDRRHSLMIEANRAYALGDEEQLRSILEAWQRSPEAVQGADEAAIRQRLLRRIAQLEEHLEMIARDRAALQESPMWQLKAMVDEEAAKGKDLVKDMVRRLKRDILVATNRLDAMQGPP